MNRVWAMPSADTFDVEPIHKFVWKYLAESKVSIDPFARNKKWATYTNDLNPKTDAQFHLDALEFLKEMRAQGIQPDLIIFDPPYSVRQCAEVYESVGRPVTQRDTQVFGRWTEHKELIGEMATQDAIVLSFGWNSIGMGKKHGFEIEELLLVAHGGAHNDTICLAERREELPLFTQQVAQGS